MNRTALFLSLAGGLGLLALVLAVPPGPAPADPPEGPLSPPTSETPPRVTRSDGSLSFDGRLSHPVIGTGRSEVFLTVDLRGADVPGAERAPINAALVIDRSGSMAGEKLAYAREAAARFVSQLRESDQVAVVHYGSDVRVFRSVAATAENKERLLAFIRRISDDGGTNIGDGLRAGRGQLAEAKERFKVNRIVLLSDGQPTEGITSPEALLDLTSGIRKAGVTVSAIGIGADYNEDLMQGIAERGAGAYGYLRDGTRLATIFQKDLEQAGRTVARGVELSFELPEGVELKEVLGYESAQDGRAVRVALTDFSAGQVERVVARLAVTGRAVGEAVDVARLRLSYRDLLAEKDVESKALVAAQVTDREEEIAARRDKDAVVSGARAQAAANVRRAADLLKKRDYDEARQVLSLNAGILGAASSVAPAAMAPVMAEQAALEASFDQAAKKSPEEVEHEVKAAKAKALRDFGRMGSTY